MALEQEIIFIDVDIPTDAQLRSIRVRAA